MYYPSNIIGNKIQNALTGELYPYYVGSKNEELFFRCIDVTGKYNTNGKKTYGNTCPNKLFFKSKEEYLEFYKKHNFSYPENIIDNE